MAGVWADTSDRKTAAQQLNEETMPFHSRFWTLTLTTIALMSVSGCVCVGGNNTGRSGDIIITWNFNGGGCASVPDVTSIAVTIPGQTLENGGLYGCINAGSPGIRLTNFRAGTYSYTVSGRNSAGQTLYEATGKVVVSGDVAVDVTLLPTASAKGSTRFYWGFPPSSTLSCNDVPRVDVWINGSVIQTVNCWDGYAGDINRPAGPGILVTGITPGQNALTLTAGDSFNSDVFYYFRSDRTFTVVAGAETAENTTLDFAVGSLPVKWTFSNGATQLTCEQAGVATVFVNLRDSTGQLLYANAGFETPCRNGQGVQGVVFSYLYSGSYQVVVQGYGTGNVLYSTSQANPPVGTVTAGSFPVIDNPQATQVVVLTP